MSIYITASAFICGFCVNFTWRFLEKSEIVVQYVYEKDFIVCAHRSILRQSYIRSSGSTEAQSYRPDEETGGSE